MASRDGTHTPHGPLRPVEVATASVLAALAAVLTVAGWFLPHLGIVAAMAVVPLGVVAHHHRLRALVAATVAASVLGFLVAGTGSVANVVACGAVGGLAGVAKRRRWGPLGVAAGMAVIAPALAGISIGLLALFSSLRKLTLAQIRNTWRSIHHVLAAVRPLAGVARTLNSFVLDALHYWWATVGVVVVGTVVWLAVLGWVFLGAALERLEWVKVTDRLAVPAEDPATPPDPVPVRLEGAGLRYPGAERDALSGVDLELAAGEMLALVGDNGSGKSTLVRLLAGRAPTAGRVVRPGPAGLGRPGGTALISQHPETQVLGVRVADDVVWGLHDAHDVDIDGLLRTVGLDGMSGRETSGLSGGELQRLAVAAALARRPRLLLSDEATAMVDEKGREELVALLRRLPAGGMAVVHVTHRPEEAAVADRLLRMAGGRLQAGAGPAIPAGAEGGDQGSPRPARKLSAPPERLVLEGVSHTYGIGSPWATEALAGIDLAVEPGEGLLVVGGNGSGKSTLAWIMAGLLRPSHGACRLGPEPVPTRIGSVGLAFQHARLQLQRPTVLKDVRAAGAPDDAAAAEALAAVGLDAGEIGQRRIDVLSGGQQRRVALAGLLARHPSVLVLDEPLAGLDHPSREGLLDLLAGLRRDQGITVVVISHDLHGMERVCERVVQLERGRIVSESATMAAGR